METYDAIMLSVLAMATIFGAWKGLAWQVASLASIFASYFLAYRFRVPLAAQIRADPPWNTFLAMLIIFLGASFVIWMLFRMVSNGLDRMQMKGFDRQTGAILGLARGALWCAIITLFAMTLLGESYRQAIVRSRSGHYIAKLLDRSTTIMPEEVHQVLAPYIQNLDQRMGEYGPYSTLPNPRSAPPLAVPSDPYGTVMPPANAPWGSSPPAPNGPLEAPGYGWAPPEPRPPAGYDPGFGARR